jgi:hypothetical protein
MTLHTRLVDIEVAGDLTELTDDSTVGLVSTYDPERFPESVLVDPERLERALIAVREEFDNPGAVNIAAVRPDDATEQVDLALYPDDARDRAVVIASKARPGDGGRPEYGEPATVEADGGDA